MLEKILSHSHSAVAFLALIVGIEVIINFKRPLILKIILLAIIFSVLLQDIYLLFIPQIGYNRWMHEIPKTIIMLCGLNLISIFHYHKIKKNIFFINVFVLVLITYVLSYYTFIFPLDQSIPLSDLKVLGFEKPIIKILVLIPILILEFNLYYKIFESYKDDNIYFQQVKKWLLAILTLNIIGLIFFFLNYILLPKNKLYGELGKVIVDALTCLLIMYKPTFLNQTDISLSLSNIFNKSLENEVNKEKFIFEFFTKTYYLKKENTLEDFCNKIDTSKDILVNFISLEYATNFIDLINKNRVNYFIELIKRGDHDFLTLEAMAEKSGFGSRQSLHRAFKKFHGGSPSDLIRAVKGI